MGSDGADDLRGGPGNDTIRDARENDAKVDTISGHDGDDQITSANNPHSRDVVNCGIDTDSVVADPVDAVDANCEDVLRVTHMGTFGPDVLTGATANDVMLGRDGADTVRGMEGADEVRGDAGDDTLYGAGSAFGDPGGGADVVSGSYGADILVGSNNADVLNGGPDNDTIYDAIEDDAAVDRINGGDGDDVISTVSTPASQDNIISCGLGVDEVYVDDLDVVADDCESVTDALADVDFTTEVSVAQALQLAEAKEANILTLEDDFVVGGEQLADFYVSPPDAGAAATSQAYEQERLGFYQDMLDDHNSADLTAEEKAEEQPMIDSMRAALASNNAGSVAVTKMTLTGEKQKLQTLSSGAFSVANSDIQSVDITDSSTVANEAREEDAAPAEDPQDTDDQTGGDVTTAAVTWYPNSGRSKVGPSAIAGKRYVSQRFKWRNQNLDSSRGYEHDFKTENFHGNHYLTGRQTRVCLPVTSYASSSLPRAGRLYLDTNIKLNGRCERDVLTYTIGIVLAGPLDDDKRYFNFIRTPKGNAGQDRAKLEADLTHHTPGCQNGFCTDTYRNHDRWLIDRPASNNWYGIPGTDPWRE